jgi:hypothetical protein
MTSPDIINLCHCLCCLKDSYTGCTCPEGFTGDGFVDGSGCTGMSHTC